MILGCCNRSTLHYLHIMMEECVEEVKITTFSSRAMKASSLDDFTFYFFQRYWNFLKDGMLAFFEDFHVGYLDIGKFNYTYVILFLKKDGILIVRVKPFP